ncbi:DUF748 domain-containing protein [Comamonas testosteroni]|uniref:DUF748 domain-containing protein n=1 Tax=Comamonas testosteroni TaxID=285 RepID=UPI0026EB49E2|nr:DUF748 domain-containing protein [Comamonas testosteroni]WQD41658.1 DUF748 domain-containing protein [Comamonas testosteroni]
MSLLTSNRWLRRLIWSVLALLLLWLLLWAVVPWVAKSQLEKQASEKLGRGVHVGKIEFAPWAMSITLHDLVIDKAIKKVADGSDAQSPSGQTNLKSAAEPQLEIKRIFINASAQSLFRLAPVLDAIEVDAPVVRLTQHSLGKLDIDDVIARLSEPKDEEPSKPVSFALYNIALRDGRIELNDEFVQRKHELKDLQLSIPFISNLASKREIKVLPHLAFDLNGSKFDTSGESTPFTDTRQTAMHLKWDRIDLAPYLGYVPASVPVQPLSGVLDTDLQISFEQKDQPVVSISGKLALSNVVLQDRQSAPLLNFEALELQLQNAQPLQSQIALETMRWVKPEIHASRNAQGVINWLGLHAPSAAAAAPAENAGPASDSSDTKASVQAGTKAETPAQPLAVSVKQFDIDSATVHWRDAATGAAPAALTLAPLVLQAKNLAWPMNAPLQLTATAGLQTAEQARGEGAARLAVDGEATDKAGSLNLKLEQMPLQWVQPYIEAHFKPQLSAMLGADARISWGEGNVVAEVTELTADKLQLQDKQAPVNIEQIKVSGVQVDLAARQVQVQAIAVQKPQLAAMRDAQGHWMYERWLPVAAPVAAPAAKPATQGGKAEPGKPWSVKLAAIAVDGGALQFRDAAPVQGANARPVQLDVSALRVRLGAFEPLAAKAAPTPLEVSAQLAASRRVQAGHIQFNGQLGLAPVSAQGQLQARAVPLHALEPYFGHKLNVDLVRADGNFRGKLNYLAHAKGPQLSVLGDVELNDLRVRSTLAAPVQEQVGKPSTAKGALTAVLNDSTADRAKALAARTGLGLGDDLLAWKTLVVRGLDLNMQPAQPLRVSVRETALSDFFARVIVQRNGRINLQDIVKTEKSEQSVAQNEEANAQAAAGEKPELSKPVAEHVKPEDAGPMPVIKVGPIVLTGGKVQFSDYFIQPNYSADLSELNGRLSAFSSQAPAGQVEPQMADLEIKGKAQGTAMLDISGKVNPLAKPLALDVRAQMNDLELSPLSPYSIKYAGYGIERGKLYMDVNYKVQPDGQLTASNKLVLRQLTFGDKVEGAPASLPVKLAVALLSDRNGVIDLDVPLSGSLNDPQFRLAPIIFKVIGNIIMKAVTAPFALLSGAFSGGDESGAVNFAPGSAKLDGKAREQLAKIVKALNDRPALKMTVVGESREAQDKEAWKTEELDRLLLAQKRRNVIREGKSGDEVMEFSEAERPALLKAVYGRADIKKPRNMVGMAKDLPADQMTALLVASINVPDDAMRELALARGVAVRDYLATQQLPLERLFLGAPKLDAQDKDWTPRAQLSLSAQ